MYRKLKKALVVAVIAFFFSFTVSSLTTKAGCKKYGEAQPISWDQLADELGSIALFSSIIAILAALLSLRDSESPKEMIVCPLCGASQVEKEEEKIRRDRQCIACKEVSSRVEWKSVIP